MKGVKRLLIVGTAGNSENNLFKSLAQQGWKIQVVNNFDEARKLLDSSRYDAGIVLIDEETMKVENNMEICIAGNLINWVALIKPEIKKCAMLGNILDRFFYGYLHQPSKAQEIDCLLCHASKMSRLDEFIKQHHHEDFDRNKMVGSTNTMRLLFDTIHRMAAVDAPICISGETGTGKELAARAIHEQSSRKNEPFIAVNCAALPHNLVQAELFGNEKGAFTGANQKKIGHIEAAEGGTLFLDEIGDLPFEMQVNLLRFLENQRIQRVGGTKEIPVNVRILSATHVNLDDAVQAGYFREDLYHRLNVLNIFLPPLRERQGDIKALAFYFFEKYSMEKPVKVKGFDEDAMTLMHRYEWPGNIREMINRIRRAMVMCETRMIKPKDLGLERRKSRRDIMTLEQARDHAEHQALISVMVRNRNNIKMSAKELGVSKITLYRLIEKHRLTTKNLDP